MTELTPIPEFAYRLVRTIDRLRAAGIDPTCVGIPTMPETDPADQPASTIFGLPVLWLPHNETGRVFVVVDE